MTEPLVFTVHGTPRPKARGRIIRGRVVTTTQKTEKLWRLAVLRAVKEALALRGDPVPIFRSAVRVSMVFTFEPSGSRRDLIGTPHTHKPDKDNLEKLVLDAMEKAGVFRNDSQVAMGPTEKWWGERAGVVVLAEPVDATRARPPSAAEPELPGWLAASRSQSQ